MNNVKGGGGVMCKGGVFWWRGAEIVSSGSSSIFYAATQTNETGDTRNKGGPSDTSKESPMGGFSLKLGLYQHRPTYITPLTHADKLLEPH